MGRQLRVFAVTVAALLALGVLAGLAWSWVSPRPPYIETQRGPLLADPTTQALIAADGWFAVITGVLALASGLIAWRFTRRDGLGAVLGLFLGGSAASLVTYWVGTRFTLGAATIAAAAPGLDIVAGPLDLTARGVLVTWPFLALGVYAAIEGVLAYRRSPMRKPYGEPGITGLDGGSRTL
ncbi:hypothetical protein ACIBG7_10380 [Nonomuraea sp. NPDC050328]|uniref:hypothetical protein n=1 Tax=Nonomuraea sp. NPDC050328 TaxID=3364361 RepID=UPI0037A2370A